jgi:hypothetical protein
MDCSICSKAVRDSGMQKEAARTELSIESQLDNSLEDSSCEVFKRKDSCLDTSQDLQRIVSPFLGCLFLFLPFLQPYL